MLISRILCMFALMPHQDWLTATVLAFSAQSVTSTSNGNDSKRFIEIVDSKSPLVDKLPTSLTENWPTWVLDETGSFTKIPDTDGFVPPASVDDLFQPLDLKPPQFRIALGIHVREGTIRHIMPALDTFFEGGEHRNRGLCSVPRAYRWMGYSNDMLVGDLQELEIRAFQRKRESNNDDEWTRLEAIVSGEKVTSTIERTIFALAESAPDELGDGSSLIHALIEKNEDGECTLEYPGNGQELCLVMDNRENLAHPEDEVKGKLQVTISATMAGSESQYLPDAYKPLYEDMSLRNPRYEEFRERKEQQQQQQQ